MSTVAKTKKADKDKSVAERKAGRSLYALAYERIRSMILKGELPPGFSALEKEIAETLGMSRTPVREALIRLEGDGLIEVLPRRGFRVLSIDMDDIREIYHLLGVLEVAAAELVASKSPDENGRSIDALAAAVDDMEEALSRENLEAWAEADARFHRLLLEMCGNGRLKRMAFTIWDQAHRVRWVTLRLRSKPEGSTMDHRALVDAIRRQDPNAAREIHRSHRARYVEMLMGLLDEYRLGLI